MAKKQQVFLSCAFGHALLLLSICLPILSGCGGEQQSYKTNKIEGSQPKQTIEQTLEVDIQGVEGTYTLEHLDRTFTFNKSGRYIINLQIPESDVSTALSIIKKPGAATCQNQTFETAVADLPSTTWRISCAQRAWNHPSSLTDTINQTNGQDVLLPLAQMTDTGRALSTWRQKNGVEQRLYVSQDTGQGFATPFVDEQVVAGAVPTDVGYAIASYRDKAILAWTNNRQQYFADLDLDQEQMTTPERISPISSAGATPNEQVQNPTVSMYDGGAHIAWRQFYWDPVDYTTPAHFYTYLSSYDGQSWKHPSQLTDQVSPTPTDVKSVKLRSNADGISVMHWLQDNMLFASVYDGQSWKHPQNLSSGIAGSASNHVGSASADIDSKGNIYIAYVAHGARQRLHAKVYRQGTWADISPVNQSYIGLPNGDIGNPKWGMHTGGAVQLFWVQKINAVSKLYKARLGTDGQWAWPVDQDDDAGLGGQVINYDVASDGYDNVMVSAIVQNGTNYRLQTLFLGAENWPDMQATHRLDLRGNSAGHIDIASNFDGQAMVTWRQHDGNQFNVYASTLR